MSKPLARRRFLTGLAALPVAAAGSFGGTPLASTRSAASMTAGLASQSEPSLKEIATRRGRYFGSAVRIEQMEADARLKDAVLRECSVVTPEIHMNWDAIECHPGKLSFKQADDLVRFARRHRLRIHGHTLIWDRSTPQWAKDAMLKARDWSPVSRHFASILSRYSRDVQQWNVINEPIDDSSGRPDGLRRNTFLRAFGPDYIRRALDEARLHAPSARFFISDHGFDYENHVDRYRRKQFLHLLERLKKANAPLDAVGIQARLDLSKGPLKQKTVAAFMKEVAGLGFDILISELDVREDGLSISLAERGNRVARETRAYLDAAMSISLVEGVIAWDVLARAAQGRGRQALSPVPPSPIEGAAEKT